MNRSLFATLRGRLLPATDATNAAGARAYALSPEHALAQSVATGTLHDSFYTSAGQQLDAVLALCDQVDPLFIAQAAVFGRERGHMKDTPALLCAVLASKDGALLEWVFDRVIDTPRMLRSFVQILRSGVTGRRSLGSRPRRLVRRWLADRSDEAVFRASVGRDPSLVDVIRMVHPHPATPSREALYGYLLGRPHDIDALPALVRHYDDFKHGRSDIVPDVPFTMLTALDLTPRHWREIAARATWQTTRMNLNTFQRRGVFASPSMVERLAERLADADAIRRARAFPYQLMIAHQTADVPRRLRDALQDAMEIATENVPVIDGQVHLLVDVSGSMHGPVTGQRGGSTSAVSCLQVAALMAATLLRRNTTAEVIAFHDRVVPVRLNARDSIMTNARTLSELPLGGTDTSAPLKHMNEQRARADLVVMVSDNQSWIGGLGGHGRRPTRTLAEWERFKARNPRAKLVCLDLAPYADTQAPERDDILNLGGFSDQVFDQIRAFARGEMGPDHWVDAIKAAWNATP